MIGLLIVSAALSGAGCGSGEDSGAPLTYQVRRQTLTSSVVAKGTVEAVKTSALTVPRLRVESLLKLSYLAPEFSYIKKGELAAEVDGEAMQTRLEQALRDLDAAKSDQATLDAQFEQKLAQLESQIKSAEASIETSRLKLAELEFIAPRERQIRLLEIQKSEIQATGARRKLDASRLVNREERSQCQLRINQAKAKCESERANLAQLKLLSPADGYVLYYENWITREFVKPGDNIIPGMPVAGIADISSIQIKLQLGETEVQNMEAGQPVEIEIESLGGLKVQGKISKVAQMAKPVRRNSDVKKVEVMVDIEGTTEGLVPGLTAVCTITKNRVDDALVAPLEAVFDQDSTKVVYAVEGDEFRQREVELGPRGNNFAVIAKGLEGGELLALRKPDQSSIISN